MSQNYSLFDTEILNSNSSASEVISVSALNKLAKNILETNLPVMWIRGEISGLKTYAHIYFDLKDDGAKISCVMFAKLVAQLDFQLENGMQVELRGRVSIYPQNGSYQINVERVRQVGLGELWEAYNRLIVKLRAEGLFDAKYKKAIPLLPNAIGVITSKEGAVIRDVITTLARRMPSIPLIIYHSAVQGSDASMQLTKAIRLANQRHEVDVLIICRGGGSMEDLWCFNEEIVAREVFNSQIPIISAVGHETDTTIIDFVADLRAPTPTAAAELVTKSRQEWLELLLRAETKLKNQFYNLYNNKQQQLDLIYANLKALNPLNKLIQQQAQIKQLQQQLSNMMYTKLAKARHLVDLYQSKLAQLKINTPPIFTELSKLEQRLMRAANNYVKSRYTQLSAYESKLNLLNPHNILSRGYAIIQNPQGKILQSVKQVKHHTRIEINFVDGKVGAIVNKEHLIGQDELL